MVKYQIADREGFILKKEGEEWGITWEMREEGNRDPGRGGVGVWRGAISE